MAQVEISAQIKFYYIYKLILTNMKTENELHEAFTLETGQDAIDQHNEYNSNYVDWLQKLYLESQTPNAFTKETERITTHLEGMRKLAKSEQVAEPVEEQSGDFKKEYLEYQDEMDGDCKSYESWLEGELRATIFQCNHAMNLLSENPLPIYQKTEDDLRTKFTHYCMATDEAVYNHIDELFDWFKPYFSPQQSNTEQHDWESELLDNRLSDQKSKNDYADRLDDGTLECCGDCGTPLNSHDHCPRCDY